MRTLSPRPLVEHHGPLPFYCVREEKLVILSVATLGLYQVYWFYKNFALAKAQYRPRTHPLWRAIFAPLYFFSLGASVECAARAAGVRERGSPLLLGLCYLGFGAFGLLPPPGFMLGLLSFIPLIPLQRQMRRVHDALRPDEYTAGGWGAGSYAALVLGAATTVALALAVVTLPSLALRQSEIPPSYRETLIEAGILRPSEQMQYFYTAGLFSIMEDGNFLTQQRAVSYQTIDGELRVSSAGYRDVVDIDVRQPATFLEPTWITLTTFDGERVRLQVSRDEGRDSEFVAQLRRYLLAALEP